MHPLRMEIGPSRANNLQNENNMENLIDSNRWKWRPASVKSVNESDVEVSGNCTFTGKHHSVTISHDGLVNYLEGDLVKIALPNASADDCEFVMSGISPEGWNYLWTVDTKERENEGL